ncbi:MAG: site-2 protease family protein [Nanoarchaeota archaeon]
MWQFCPTAGQEKVEVHALTFQSELISLIGFAVILSIFVYFKRHKAELQKVIWPVIGFIQLPLLYVFLFKTGVGLKFMDRVASKWRGLLKLIGYSGVGFAFVGAFFIGINLIWALVNFLKAPATTETGVTLVLPLTTVPGLGFISFWYWIITLFVLVVVHEFAHGILMRVHNVKVKSSGFGFVGVVAPIIPLAFVEQDQKELEKKEGIVQHSIFAAGPMANISLAIILLIIFANPFGPNLQEHFDTKFTEPKGFSVDITDPSYPAGLAGMTNGTIITSYNGQVIEGYQTFVNDMFYCIEPGDTVVLGTDRGDYALTTIPSPDDESKGFIGIHNIKDERVFKPEYQHLEGAYLWVKGLIRFMILLNFLIGLANFIPIFMTDGAQMFRVALLESMKNKKRAIAIWYWLNMVFVALLIILLGSTYLKALIP